MADAVVRVNIEFPGGVKIVHEAVMAEVIDGCLHWRSADHPRIDRYLPVVGLAYFEISSEQ